MIEICDLKKGATFEISTVCLHRARRRHALICPLIEEDQKPKKKIGYIKEGQARYGKNSRLS
jgi:hypothetical protein